MPSSARRLRALFRAIVFAAPVPAACGSTPEQTDGSADDATIEAGCSALCLPDVAFDTYVDWCDAGPPNVIANDGCFAYFYVPCGLPTGIYPIDDAGTLNQCEQICKGVSAMSCELTNNPFDSFDAGDASDAAAEGSVYVRCLCSTSGRRPVGLRRPRRRRDTKTDPLAAYLTNMAHLEAAAVPAFERLRDELAVLGAPRRLLERVERAARDEARHARVVGKLARHFGGTAPAARVRKRRVRTAVAVACENAVEGCVRETFGALVATWQSVHARDPRVRRVMPAIAADETRHAAVSWEVARFLERALDTRARSRVAAARTRAVTKLYEESSRDPLPSLVHATGLPRALDARRLLDALARTVLIDGQCNRSRRVPHTASTAMAVRNPSAAV